MVRRKLHMLNSAGKAKAVVKQWRDGGSKMPAYYAGCAAT